MGTSATYNLDAAVGPERLEAIVRELYDLLFDDVLVGFLFAPHDKETLIASQQRWLRAHLGDRAGEWHGGSIRALHHHLPILPGHFDRRHFLLKGILERHEVPEHVREEWLSLDLALRPLVLNLGAAERDRILRQDPS